MALQLGVLISQHTNDMQKLVVAHIVKVMQFLR